MNKIVAPDIKIFTELMADVSTYSDLIASQQPVPDHIRSRVNEYINILHDPRYKRFFKALKQQYPLEAAE
jgi:hypothetical protein